MPDNTCNNIFKLHFSIFSLTLKTCVVKTLDLGKHKNFNIKPVHFTHIIHNLNGSKIF